jgi:hypothetical protein
MNCAQSGCKITPHALLDAGAIPANCPTCNHPLRLVMEPGELAELMGLPTQAEVEADIRAKEEIAAKERETADAEAKAKADSEARAATSQTSQRHHR